MGLWAALALLFAQDSSVDAHLILLNRTIAHMREVLSHTPNYTCTETVRRTRRDSLKASFEPIDTIRMEVAVADGKELFAWPGSKKFEDSEIDHFVSGGAFGNGDFSLHAHSVFATNAATFTYAGEQTVNGRAFARFEYKIPQNLSGFVISVPAAKEIVPYRGGFVVDEQTFDVRELDVVADDLPRSLRLKGVVDRLRYAPMEIGGKTFLLPTGSEMTMSSMDGRESRNETSFGGCHEYSGESVLKFEEEESSAEGPTAVSGEKKTVHVPANQLVILQLGDELDLTKSAVGDRLRAVLTGDIKKNGTIFLHKGATALGRIIRLERGPNYIAIGFAFDEIEDADSHADVRMDYERGMGFDTVGNLRSVMLSVLPKPGEGFVLLKPGTKRLGRGILMYWRSKE